MSNMPEKSSGSAIDTKELKKHITSECKKTEQKILEKIPGMEDTLKKLMEQNMKLETDLGQGFNLRFDWSRLYLESNILSVWKPVLESMKIGKVQSVPPEPKIIQRSDDQLERLGEGNHLLGNFIFVGSFKTRVKCFEWTLDIIFWILYRRILEQSSSWKYEFVFKKLWNGFWLVSHPIEFYWLIKLFKNSQKPKLATTIEIEHRQHETIFRIGSNHVRTMVPAWVDP